MRISEDMERVKMLQRGHGKWAEAMLPVSINLFIYSFIYLPLILHCTKLFFWQFSESTFHGGHGGVVASAWTSDLKVGGWMDA